MLQINNSTPFKTQLMLFANREGVDTVYALIKGTFTFDDAVRVSPEQLPITVADKHYADPATSSVQSPSDVSLEKPATDVVVIGSAWAPHEIPAWQCDASVSVASVTRSVRVFGDRVWESGATGATASWVAPFIRMPLVWERAFGGSDIGDKGPTADWRNPVGVGFRAKGSATPISGSPIANIEDPGALISSAMQTPAPAGFGPVPAHWLPRRNYAGTYDEQWERNRAPYLPDDFDPRFCQIAPLGLVMPGILRGGEAVELRGVTPAGLTRFALPKISIEAQYHLPNKTETRPALMDTVILQPDDGRLVLVWRAALPCDKQALKVREVEITAFGDVAVAA